MELNKLKNPIQSNAKEYKSETRKKNEQVFISNILKQGVFHKGILRCGQELESKGSICIIGDVQVGATVTAMGNIVIIGALRGNANAGLSGDDDAFVLALDMDPLQIRIGSAIGRSADKDILSSKKNKKNQKKNTSPQIAFVKEGNIFIENMTKDFLF